VFKNSRDSNLFVTLQNVFTGQKYELNNIESYNQKWVRYAPLLDNVKDLGGTYRVLFTAVLNATSGFVDPYIALDDISFSAQCTMQSNLNVVTDPVSHSTLSTAKPDTCATISCAGNDGSPVCLQPTQYCDWVKDCKDGSDEAHCGNCDFNDGQLGGWKTYLGRKLWTVLQPASNSPSTLPKVDGEGKPVGGFVALRSAIILPRQAPAINVPLIESQLLGKWEWQC